MGFAKLDDEFAGSSLLVQGGLVLAGFWAVLLSMKGREGRIYESVPMMARRCGTNPEHIWSLLTVLASPDPHSRTPDHEGRRIVIEKEPRFCIVILNHCKYMQRDDDTAKDRMRRMRERRKVGGGVTHVTPVTGTVTASQSTSLSSVRSVVPLEGSGEVPPDDRPADRFIRGSNFRAASDLDVKILQAVRQLVEATGEAPHVWMRRVTSYKRPDGTMTAGVEDPARLGSVLAREKALADAEWHLAELAKEREAKRGA